MLIIHIHDRRHLKSSLYTVQASGLTCKRWVIATGDDGGVIIIAARDAQDA